MRRWGERRSIGLSPGRGAGAVLGSALALSDARPASAATLFDQLLSGIAGLSQQEIVVLALILIILVFAAGAAVLLLRTRGGMSRELAAARSEIAYLRDQAERAQAILVADPQLVVIWQRPRGEPVVLGDGTKVIGAASERVLAFGSWLDPERASGLEQAVDLLRRRGDSFNYLLMTTRGRYVEADGRPINGAAVLRLRDVTGVRREQAALFERNRELEREAAEARHLLEAMPMPIWMRDAKGRLSFVNRAYARAVDAASPEEAIERRLELLDAATRDEAARVRQGGHAFAKRVPVVVAGARRVLDVLEVGGASGAAGIGLEATEAESLRAELARAIAAHRRTLDQLPTAVAIFAADQRLVFYNAAYRALFKLDAAFLDDRPTDSAVLDRLRAERMLPEQADFRAWTAQLHEAYRALEPRDHWWHLPGGRTLRVVTTPNPEGGVTYLFDDVTERIALESRHNALVRTQRETLDALSEGVAVFGSDGRLKLYNAAFVELWHLSPPSLDEQPHIETIAQQCRPLLGLPIAPPDRPELDPWSVLQLAVTSLERRLPVECRIERTDGIALECAAVPLPDGGTLVTFRNVTDSVRVEQALRDRNEALVAGDALKNAFVGHVSYELRSPLTTIIGFAQLLGEPGLGPLNKKQREYVAHINEAGTALLALINDILDLATIDAGAMVLDLTDVDIRSAVEAAVEGVRMRAADRKVRLNIKVPAKIGSFVADAKRVRQVLFNLLSNAVGFSPEGETVTLAAERRGDSVVFRVSDKGPGIPPELKQRIFDRFETHPAGSPHRGAGLGLSIVRSLMELHGGSVSIDSEPGKGTVAVCVFPAYAVAGSQAAE